MKLIAAFLVLIVATSGCKESAKPKESSASEKSLTQNIGEQFTLSNLLDSAGNQVELDFAKSDITIVDFWFNECPPCITELNQFAGMLRGKEKKVTINSISVNQPWAWQGSRQSATENFAFFQQRLSNWNHYVLRTTQNQELKNSISTDRVEELEKLYHVSFFPAYFVVDNKGKILARPASAVEYLKGL